MAIQPGAHTFGPDNATLRVKTGRSGAAAKAGHDLVIEVTSWEAELDVAKDPAITLTADGGSLRVREGSGGVTTLGDDEKAGIEQTIDEEVLKGEPIEFRSTSVDGSRVEGELELAGETRPIGFELAAGEDGRLTATAVVRQSDWGMRPYTGLFGTLKVVDEVEVEIDAALTYPV